MKERRRTSTSNFGVGARENHDATAFYDRFRAPELSADSTVLAPRPVAEPFICADARSMDAVEDGSVALVVTSPPYFAGKQYEEELEREGVPSSYLEYLQLLTDVFAVPAWVPFANVFSVGDVLIAVGIAWAIAATMRRGVVALSVPDAQNAPGAPDVLA